MKSFSYAILVCMLLSCGEKEQVVSFPKETEAKVEILKETLLGTPLDMDLQENTIYVSDFRGDTLLWRFDKQDLNSVSKIVPYGEGPDESLTPIQFFVKDTVLVVHNRWHFAMQEFRHFPQRDTLISLCDKVRLSTDIDLIQPVSGNRYIASGRFNGGRFILMDDKGKILSTCGSYPDYQDGEEEYPNFPRFMFHQTVFGYQPQKQLLAAATGHVLDIWQEDEKQSFSLVKRVLLSPYKYTCEFGDDWAGAQAEKWVEFGAKRIYTTPERIYLLYDPNTEEMKEAKKEKLNSEIWVFDWEGNAIEKMRTDRELTCLCVDEAEGKIYCIANAPDASIGVINRP